MGKKEIMKERDQVIPGIAILDKIAQSIISKGPYAHLVEWDKPLWMQRKEQLSKSPRNLGRFLYVRKLEKEACENYDSDYLVVDLAMRIAEISGNEPVQVMARLVDLYYSWKGGDKNGSTK